ncbi:MAG: hypothetical protein ABFS34_16085 [Gemmatimonadota bacterium]
MRAISAVFALTALAACATTPPSPMPSELRSEPGPDGFNARAVVDEARDEVVVWAGPFRVAPNGPAGHAHGDGAEAQEGRAETEDHGKHAEEHAKYAAEGHDDHGEEHAHEGEGHAHEGERHAHDAGDHDHDGEEHDHDGANHAEGGDHAGPMGEAPDGDPAAENVPGHEGHTRSPVIPIDWPADGYIRGFALELHDGDGNVLPRSLMHHLIAVNFDRRMFAYPVAERLFGIGTETEDVRLPRTLGVPLEVGQNLGFYIMWDNKTGAALEEVFIKLALPWTPGDEADDIIEVLPLYVDVNNEIGFTNAFDLEPGPSVRSWEFQPPVGGRMLMASGHLHDFGKRVRLVDAETGEVLVEITGDLDEQGLIHGISREVMGVWHGGVRLEEGRTYRVVGEYDSPLEETLPLAAMAHIVGLFAPDDMNRWPSAEPQSEIWTVDLSGLPRYSNTMTQARDVLRPDGGVR